MTTLDPATRILEFAFFIVETRKAARGDYGLQLRVEMMDDIRRELQHVFDHLPQLTIAQRERLVLLTNLTPMETRHNLDYFVFFGLYVGAHGVEQVHITAPYAPVFVLHGFPTDASIIMFNDTHHWLGECTLGCHECIRENLLPSPPLFDAPLSDVSAFDAPESDEPVVFDPYAELRAFSLTLPPPPLSPEHFWANSASASVEHDYIVISP